MGENYGTAGPSPATRTTEGGCMTEAHTQTRFVQEIASEKPFLLELIRSTRGFERLLEGFESARAVTYVAQARNVLDFFSRGYSQVELVLGESFTDVRGSLDVGTLEKLTALMEEGRLRLYTPRKTIHSKMYILEKPGLIRILHGSRNLYPTGSWDSVAVYDLPPTDATARDFVRHYEEHLEGCSLFLGDLVEHLRREPEKRKEILEAFLQQGSDEDSGGVAVILREATFQAVQNPGVEVLNIELPKDAQMKKEVERVLEVLRPSRAANELVVRTKDYLGFVERTIGMPVMVVDPDRAQVRLVMGGEVRERATALPEDRAEVDRGLDHIERYLATANSEAASPRELAAQKSGMYEGILYILSAPFFHEQMKIRRDRFGMVDRRGPLFLMLYGRSSNGKTTFLQFGLNLLAGEPVSPLPGKEFKETTLERARNLGTVFPLVFDDIASVTNRPFENIVKSYWEKRWSAVSPVPQLIFSSNSPTLRDWGRTRVKRIVFPVYFKPTPAKKEELHRLLLEENHVFEWFAYLYMQRLRERPDAPADDLALARSVMRELYSHAGRQVPPDFPEKPVEQTFDTAVLEWQDLLDGIRKANLVREGARVRLDFTPDMQKDDVVYYEHLLPMDVNRERKGNTILVYSADAFLAWLGRPTLPLRGSRGDFTLTGPRRLLSKLKGFWSRKSA